MEVNGNNDGILNRKQSLLMAMNERKEKALYNFNSDFSGRYGSVGGYFVSYALKADGHGKVNKRGFLDDNIRCSSRPILLLYDHDYYQIVGLVTRIEERQAGVFMEADFMDTERAQEIRKLVSMGAVAQLSCALYEYVVHDVYLPDGSRAVERGECDLLEISITPEPAQPMCVITDIN